jgi:hypothetical protein
MAEKNFFDLFKEKMAALRPSTRHRDADWATLSEQLDQAKPQQLHDRRRAWIPLLLLLLALLGSNAFWWQRNQGNQAAMQHIELQLAGLQTSISALKSAPPNIRIDTIWRTVYLRMPNQEQFMAFGTPRSNETVNDQKALGQEYVPTEKALPQPAINTYSERRETIGTDPDRTGSNLPIEAPGAKEHTDPGQELFVNKDVVDPLQISDLDVVNSLAKPRPLVLEFLPDSILKPYKPRRPLGPSLLNALKPRYIKVGAIAGWLHPASPALMHQIGFEAGVQGAIGFSRHWSVILEYTYGQLHYEADKPSAILGTPEFPVLPSPEYHYAHLNIQRQPLRQFGLGLRYTFSEWRNSRPYIGLNWGNQTVMPYKIEYEVQHEPSSTIQKRDLSVVKRVHLLNTLRFGAGLEIPLARRFDLTVEGFYLRQWEKKNKDALDMTGIRAGLNWTF